MKKIVYTNILVILLLSMIPSYGYAQLALIPKKEKFHHNKSFEDEFGYVQALKVDNTVYISGIAAKGSMKEALSRVYERASKILANYNLTLNHIVKETIYTTQFDELVENRDIRKKYYKGDYPTSTWVQIQRLYSPEAVIEIEFIAVIKDKSGLKRK